MPSPDRFIASCKSWDDFWDGARELTEADKGITFERLTQLYLETAPEYRTKLQDVWLLRDIPIDVRRRLNLPGPRDDEHLYELGVSYLHQYFFGGRCSYRH